MEANLKEHQITFSKGMSNIPSDNLCDDNCLSDCIGMRMKDGELKPIQNPEKAIKCDGKLIYVHKTATYKHYIYFKDGVHWETNENEKGDINIEFSGEPKIASIGNTLIFTTSKDGLSYSVWKEGKYVTIKDFPDIVLTAYRSLCNFGVDKVSYVPDEMDGDTLKKVNENLNSGDVVVKRNEVVGLIEAANKKALSKGYFTFPFWLRAAIKLYDGSYTKITPPILVFPTVRRGAFIEMHDDGKGNYRFAGANAAWNISVNLELTGGRNDFEDIIEGVTLFMSEPVKTYEDVSWENKNTRELGTEIIYDYIDINGEYQSVKGEFGSFGNSASAAGYIRNDNKSIGYILPYYEKTDDEIIEDLLSKSIFYKIVDQAPFAFENEIGGYSDLGTIIKKEVLENLTTQEQLEHDDYYSYYKYKPKLMYTYNNRLQIANIVRTPWQGKYTPDNYDSKRNMECWVEIDGKDGKMYPKMEVGNSNAAAPIFFFYPDANAKYAIFATGVKMNLKPHPRLNGAYYFKCLPPNGPMADENAGEISLYDWEDKHPVGHEVLNTTVMTSEVNNPWVFNAEGDNTVGTGEIIGVVSNTKALSQGQFGQHPLIVFTTEGIYALGTNTEGLYNTNYPLSREVCNNADSITPTDGAIFFTSEKGLMMMVGSEITCVTQQMMGKTFNMPTITTTSMSEPIYGVSQKFLDFLKEGKIAYDYKDGCLYILKSDCAYCYVYDIASGAISRNSTKEYISVVNDYPDNLLQGKDGQVYSLLNKINVNDDTNDYNAQFISRPVKFSDAQSLKSLRQIKHVMDISGTMGMHIYVSNDLKHWGEITSLRGSGWKYFRFGLQFTNLKATDSYSGMICITQTKRFNKLR